MNESKVFPYVYKKEKGGVIDTIEDTIEDLEHSALTISKKINFDIGNNVEDFYFGWKKFVFKDNIIHVAVGMIVATSFKKTVNSLVVDIIMPLLLGFGVGSNVEDLFVVLLPGESLASNETYITLEDAKKDGAVTWNYGSFINIFFDLIFITLCLYISLKLIYRTKYKIKKLEKELHLTD